MAGTGGALYSFVTVRLNSEVRVAEFDVLKLSLGTSGYDWAFITTDGATRDAGSGACH